MRKALGRYCWAAALLCALTLVGGVALAHEGQIVQTGTGEGYSDGHNVSHPTDSVSGAIDWTFSWQKSGKVNGIYLKVFYEAPLVADDTDDGTCTGDIVANTTASEGKKLARQDGHTLTTHVGSGRYCAQLGITGSGTVTASVAHSP